MPKYIDKSALVAEIKKRLDKLDNTLIDGNKGYAAVKGAQQLISLIQYIDTLEVKELDLTNEKTKWSPSKKQMESLKDMLKWNIGDFNYQKWMEVNSLYDDLKKLMEN